MRAVVFATINQEALLVMVYHSEVDSFSLENYFLCTVLLVYPHFETCSCYGTKLTSVSASESHVRLSLRVCV